MRYFLIIWINPIAVDTELITFLLEAFFIEISASNDLKYTIIHIH